MRTMNKTAQSAHNYNCPKKMRWTNLGMVNTTRWNVYDWNGLNGDKNQWIWEMTAIQTKLASHSKMLMAQAYLQAKELHSYSSCYFPIRVICIKSIERESEVHVAFTAGLMSTAWSTFAVAQRLSFIASHIICHCSKKFHHIFTSYIINTSESLSVAGRENFARRSSNKFIRLPFELPLN